MRQPSALHGPLPPPPRVGSVPAPALGRSPPPPRVGYLGRTAEPPKRKPWTIHGKSMEKPDMTREEL